MFYRKGALCGIFFGTQLIVAVILYFGYNSLARYELIPSSSSTSGHHEVTREEKEISRTMQKLSSANPIPDESILRNMSMVDLVKFYHSYVVAPQVICNTVTRMGRLLDGGWELCEDPAYRPDNESCLVYSYGIGYDFSFDDDMVKYGCEVHAFDPTMDIEKDYTTKTGVHFHPRGIGKADKILKISNRGRVIKAHVDTIGTHRRMYKHQPHKRRLDVVKIDVEGHELEALMTSLDDGSLNDTRQLNFETHLTLAPNFPPKTEIYIKYLLLFQKVYAKGFRIYTSHRNYVHSRFLSRSDRKYHAACHEIHTVNILNRNDTAI